MAWRTVPTFDGEQIKPCGSHPELVANERSESRRES